MCLDVCAVNTEGFIVGICVQIVENLLQQTTFLPLYETFVCGLPCAVAFWQVPPRCSAAGNPHDRIEQFSRIPPRSAYIPVFLLEIGLQSFPFTVSYFVASDTLCHTFHLCWLASTAASFPLHFFSLFFRFMSLETHPSDEWKDYNVSSKKIAHDEIASRLFDMLCSDNHRHFDPSNVAFESLAGQYHCYFWATDNTSSTPHHATLKLIPNTYLCEVTFELKYQNNRRAKVYTGYAFATDAHICFCILRGKRNVTTGELCLLAFKYFPINSGPLPIALAEALTVSTGNSERAPVTHRMLLSRQEIDASEIKDIFPCISIYPLSLFVEEDIVTKLSLSDDEKRVLTQAVSASTSGTYIRLSELIIKGLGEQQGLNSSQTMTLIQKIRQESAKKNNDIVTLEDRQLAYHILTDNTHTEGISDAD